MIDDKDWDRAAYARRKRKPLTLEPAGEPTEPTSAAARMEAEFERRRGDALAVSRRQSRLKRHKVFLLKAVHGCEVKP
jgi:hypothetical protein